MKMVKGKRTVLALLLALCMIVMLLPATVFAEGENEAAEATNNPSGEEVIAGGTTNGGAGDQTVGSATTDTANKPVNGGTDKPEGIVVEKGQAIRLVGRIRRVNTTVRNNFTDCLVTDAINVTVGQDYIIDFTKEDNLSYCTEVYGGSE